VYANYFKEINMKITLTVLFFLGLTASVYSQNIALSAEIESKVQHGVSYKVDKDFPVRSIFQNAKVINISSDANDNRNFGSYVETLVQLNYVYKGNQFIDEIYVVYSNLSQISVEIDQILDPGLSIGYGGGSGINIYKTNELYVYIYTKKNKSIFGSKNW
jgi:hypothetical protein